MAATPVAQTEPEGAYPVATPIKTPMATETPVAMPRDDNPATAAAEMPPTRRIV